jgi:general secretion pathway protein I
MTTPGGRSAGFTLLEVMVAVAVLALALVSLLGLHVRNLALLERDQRLTETTLLARALMTEVEVEPFPDFGVTDGDFGERYPERYPGLRWEREVVATPLSDIREVRLRVYRESSASGTARAPAADLGDDPDPPDEPRSDDEVRLVYYVRLR